ncbi:MAG TPA: aminotransferase class IV [Symbiobacteriaceae bacterium]|nr:aminotransferase class IV [Symbiobacteriaceae bacterium]
MIYLDLGGSGPGLSPREEAQIPVNDRGLLYGDGLFETMLLRNGTIGLIDLHFARMKASARFLGIPFDPDQTRENVLALVKAMPDDGEAEHAVRITLTRGSNGRWGYRPPPEPLPTLLITTSPYRRPAGPLSALTASFRASEHSPFNNHKTTSALDKVMARAEAARAGVDEALLLNLAGRVAEGTAHNLFIVRQGLWMTPPVSEGCLPGVMRQRVLSLSGGVEFKITPEDLFRCDGVYLTNALVGCLPLAALDGRSLPWGSAPSFLPRLWEVRT